MIVALYDAQGGETVFDVRVAPPGDIPGKRRITVAEGDDPIVGRISGLNGYVDAYICWHNDEPVQRVPAWSVCAAYQNEGERKT